LPTPADTANNILKDPTTGEVTIITMDDVMLYQHDFVRAYQLVYAMFGDCLHYLISKEIKAGDPVGIFRELDRTSTCLAIKPRMFSSTATLKEISILTSTSPFVRIWISFSS
jgi:hypothetical protein